MVCPRGQELDPREICTCIDKTEYDSLFNCEPPAPKCDLTIYDCPTTNFEVDLDLCECQCNKECQTGTKLNEDTCSCEMVLPPPTEEFKCDRFGQKHCYDDPDMVNCQYGYFDEKACTCMGLAACRMMCPNGQMLDPRERCECVDE